jgi:iron-sulfur cluster repair protein YtfE (RIC family)
MNFNDETKVKDIALSNPAARQILEDAGLDYCCGGGKSLHEACLHADVPAEEILNRLRENSKHASPDKANPGLRGCARMTTSPFNGRFIGRKNRAAL